MEYDDVTLNSFSTSFAHTSTNGIEVGTNNGAKEGLYAMLVETKLQQERFEAALREKEEALKQQALDRASNRNLLNDLSNANSQKEQQQTKRVLDAEEKLAMLGKRMDAYEKSTLGQSITSISKPFVSDLNPLTKVLEILFFLKPMKLLGLLQKNPDVVKWCALPR
jgi:hypothetical protein